MDGILCEILTIFCKDMILVLMNLITHYHSPPSEEMRDIKMWPPYGTYDANGHRVEQ